MGFSKYHPSLLLIPLSLLLLLLLLPNLVISADFTTLIYKGCSGQPLPDSYQPVLTSLFDSLITQSSSAHFYKTTTGGGGGGGGIFGLFQCRGDLSAADCSNCVGQIPKTADRLCGRAAAARIQLTGCYGLYAAGGPPGVSGTSMLFKTCSSNQAVGSGFEVRRDTAFSNVQGGLAGGGGFYVTTYESVYAMGQCEGDLSVSDCGECVSAAVQKAEVECGSAIAGQVFLDKCYFSYSYYPNGVPRGGDGGGGFGDDGDGGSHGSGQTGKTVAIVVGGAAALGFLVICLLFIRSLWKKRDDY